MSDEKTPRDPHASPADAGRYHEKPEFKRRPERVENIPRVRLPTHPGRAPTRVGSAPIPDTRAPTVRPASQPEIVVDEIARAKGAATVEQAPSEQAQLLAAELRAERGRRAQAELALAEARQAAASVPPLEVEVRQTVTSCDSLSGELERVVRERNDLAEANAALEQRVTKLEARVRDGSAAELWRARAKAILAVAGVLTAGGGTATALLASWPRLDLSPVVSATADVARRTTRLETWRAEQHAYDTATRQLTRGAFARLGVRFVDPPGAEPAVELEVHAAPLVDPHRVRKRVDEAPPIQPVQPLPAPPPAPEP